MEDVASTSVSAVVPLPVRPVAEPVPVDTLEEDLILAPSIGKRPRSRASSRVTIKRTRT